MQVTDREMETMRRQSGRAAQCSEIYVFGRAEGFYILEVRDDAEAIRNAECNPGTQNVSTIGGRPVWPNNASNSATGDRGASPAKADGKA